MEISGKFKDVIIKIIDNENRLLTTKSTLDLYTKHTGKAPVYSNFSGQFSVLSSKLNAFKK